MGKKKTQATVRTVVGVITRRPFLQNTTLRIGSNVEVATTDLGRVNCKIVGITRNVTGLKGINNIGPGHIVPSFIVTVQGAEDGTNGFVENFIINDHAIDSVIYRETSVEEPVEEVQMIRE